MEIPPGTARDLGAYTCNEPSDNASGCKRWIEYGAMVYDSVGRKIHGWGGGHSTTARTDVSAFDLATLDWGSLYPSTPCAAMTVANHHNDGYWKSTGHASSRHIWDMMCIGQKNGKRTLMILSTSKNEIEGCGWFDPGGGLVHGKLCFYDLEAPVHGAPGSWSFSANFSEANAPWYYASACEYDAQSGKVVVAGLSRVLGGGNVWIYDPTADTIVTAGPVPPNCGYANNLIYFPPTDKFYLISRATAALGGVVGVFEITLNRANLAASTCVQVTGITGAPALDDECGFAYDSVNQLIGGGVKGGVMHFYNPPAKAWTSQTMTSSSGEVIGSSSVMHNVTFIDQEGVYAFMTDYPSGQRTWAYRYKE